MRIKINDKIYRLKEIESGVDSLMELVEEPRYKDGDFVYEDGRIMIVKSYPSNYHANAYPEHSNRVCYNDWYGVDFSSPTFRHAAEEEKQLLIDEMRKDGKRWNSDKKCIEDIPERKFKNGDKVKIKDRKRWNAENKCVEDIPKRKFKAGDKVKIRDGVSSKTHSGVGPGFNGTMDDFIGIELTVEKYNSRGYVVFHEDIYEYCFAEDWLEPWSDDPKNGDLAIFWNNNYLKPLIRLYHSKSYSVNKHYDNMETYWDNAVKWDGTKEQFEKVLRGEI